MQRSLRLLSVSALALLLPLCAAAAHADTIQTFGFSATLTPHKLPPPGQVSEVDGTVTIDTTTGTVESGSFAFDGGAQMTPTDLIFRDSSENLFEYSDISLGVYRVGFKEAVDLALAVPNFIGYAGGSLCTLDAPCDGSASSALVGIRTFDFQSGDISAVPEPSSLALLGTGLLSVVGIVRRRRA